MRLIDKGQKKRYRYWEDGQSELLARHEEVKRIINHPERYLKTAFQPIVRVRNGEIYGFEALSRIVGLTSFDNIAELFPFAEKIGELYPIETRCRRKAIASSAEVLKQKELLFLNINPQVLTDPDFASGQTRKLLTKHGLQPSDVVLELTERSAIEDFEIFREALAHYRNQGYLIALDDVGAGYSSLQSIAELHPDFLKVDRSLISGINANPTKWALLETFLSFSKRIGCRVVAEGVETMEEFATVVQLGADLVQGYFLARPNFNRAQVAVEALEILKHQRTLKNHYDSTTLSLVEPLALFKPNTMVSVVQEHFYHHNNQWLVGVVENEKIIGVLQREKLYASLGTKYGVSLYSNREIALLMDKKPLVVEDSTPIEVVSSLAMERPESQLYQGIVVVHNQKPIGMVSVAAMMKIMAERQIQIARGANPLTGLPGNTIIDQELALRLEEDKGFALIYADLNQFKYYNDIFGFKQGDMAIKLVGEILEKDVYALDEEGFVGHIGGDDFIVILNRAKLEKACKVILNHFSQEIERLLGREQLSLALAAVVIKPDSRWTTFEISERAAQIKKQVKAQTGNAYLIN